MMDDAAFEAHKRLLPIKAAADVAKRQGLRTVIVLQEFPNGQWGYTSYGDTRASCRRAQKIASDAMSAAELAAGI